MERRVLLAIFLSFLVLYVYQALVVKPVPKPAGARAGAPASSPGPAAASQATPSPESQTPPNAAPAVPAPPSVPQAAALVGETSERDVRIETANFIAVFTNRGARLKSWRLKKYLDRDRQPQELVEQSLPTQPLPFTLRTSDDQVNATINGALYKAADAPNGTLTSATDVRFEYRDSAGVRSAKTFHFDPATYVVGFSAEVASGDKTLPAAIVWGPGIGDIFEVSRYSQKAEGILYVDGKVRRLAAKDFAKQPAYDGDFRYAGIDDNYFIVAALTTGAARVSYQPVAVPPPANTKEQPRELVSFTLDPQTPRPVQFFIGPKDFDVLASVDREFTQAINFGMFAVIVVPLLRSLKWVNGFIGNYGWSIVILTIMINAIMFPLRHKSAVSMRRMQEIQPQVKAIQDRYAKFKATDPAKQKMNQELMALYRDKGVNPAGGCVPMLLTFPVMLAMWALLQTSIELRGAPWIGWIHDLTAHDPYYVLAVLMGATSFWQQWLMPSAGADPAQQKMMMFMPLLMTGLLAWLPAGVLLYYVVTNLWGIGQQYLTNYLIGPPTIKAARPPAERRVKRVGGGKTEAAARES